MKKLIKRDLYLLGSKKNRILLSFIIISTIFFIQIIVSPSTEIDFIYILGGITEMNAKQNMIVHIPYIWQIFILSNIFTLHDFFRYDLHNYGLSSYILSPKYTYFTSKLLCSTFLITVTNIIYYLLLIFFPIIHLDFKMFSIIICGQVLFLTLFQFLTIFLKEIHAFIVVFLISFLGWSNYNGYFPANMSMPIHILSSSKTVLQISIYYLFNFFILLLLGNYVLQKKEIY